MIRRTLAGLSGVLAACMAFAGSSAASTASAQAAAPAVPSSNAPAAQAAAPAVKLAQVSPEALQAMLAGSNDRVFVLDVRTPQEFAAGHVPGAVNIPHDQVATHLAEIPKDEEIVLYCHSGRRAGLAAEELAANGYRQLAHLEGDMQGWQKAGLPVEASAGPAN